MPTYDVAIVGGGPAGSACAARLHAAGAQVVLLDAARFPRDKVCAGWITPRVFEQIGVTPETYRAGGLVLESIDCFTLDILNARHPVTLTYAGAASYAVRRCEFDTFLLRRSNAEVREGERVTSIVRRGGDWLLNGTLTAKCLVGAGGQFCPVSAVVQGRSRVDEIVAREIEASWSDRERQASGLRGPALWFSHDLTGYGWVVPKQGFVNIGFGRKRSPSFNADVNAFANTLRRARVVPERLLAWRQWKGHAYRLRGSQGRAGAEGVVLAGDALGLAFRESGEGISPAIGSGIRAAEIIARCGGDLSEADVRDYSVSLGLADGRSPLTITLPAALNRLLFRVPFVAQRAFDRWFLRRHARPEVAA